NCSTLDLSFTPPAFRDRHGRRAESRGKRLVGVGPHGASTSPGGFRWTSQRVDLLGDRLAGWLSCLRPMLFGCSGGVVLGFRSMSGTRFGSRSMSPSGI